MKSDASLRRGLVQLIQLTFPDRSDRIQSDGRAGVATLAGHVDRDALKTAVEARARSAPGVDAVVSELDVFVSHFSRRPDADIQSSAARILARTGCLPPGSVEVVVSDGWSTSSGRTGGGVVPPGSRRAVCEQANLPRSG